ncbi:MAG: pyridoxal-phosphate dependent enzyme [Fluviicola sp.]|nr:pyridoxal-phosphate dependent enzyme [Fluviicola sp.]
MSRFQTERSILQELQFPDWEKRSIRVLVKRDDLIDPFVSGNKWRKLKYIIELALHQQRLGIVTLGGAYSNHLLATAAACEQFGLKSIGLVRGEELTAESNENLQRCAAMGMDLRFISRDEYSERYEKERQEIWKQQHPDYLFVPEGGATYHGLIGCQEIWTEINEPIDHVFVAQGTTTTSCGLLLGSDEKTTVHVVPALKGFDSLEEMRPLLYQFLIDSELVNDYLNRVVIHSEAHFGGYAKATNELIEFIGFCKRTLDLPLDRVYTGKAFYALMKALESEEFDGKTVLFVHTGGLING